MESDFKARMDNIQAEIAVVKTEKELNLFLKRHPVIHRLGQAWLAASALLKVIYWLIILALAVVGLKAIWIAVQWLWRLI